MFDTKDGWACASRARGRESAKKDLGPSIRPGGRIGASCADARFAAIGAAGTKGKILVTDENLMTAELVCDALREQGYSIVGPAGTLATACALAQTADLDGAVLDFRLHDDFCFPVAALLQARGVPFIVLTGYPKWRDYPTGFEPASWINKPVDHTGLLQAVDLMVATSSKVKDHVQVTPDIRSAAPENRSATPCNLRHASPSHREPAAGEAHGKRNGVRVFLVEGDSHCRATLAALLAKQGFDVQSFDEDSELCESLAGDAHRVRAPAGDVARGKLVLNQSQRRTWWNGSVVPLSAGEFEIVQLLAANPGRYVGHRAIYDCLHYEGFLAGNGDNGFCVNVRSAIRRIRKKFREVDGDFCEIENSWAFGYCWRQDPLELAEGPQPADS